MPRERHLVYGSEGGCTRCGKRNAIKVDYSYVALDTNGREYMKRVTKFFCSDKCVELICHILVSHKSII